MHTDRVESSKSWVELPYNPQKKKKLSATCDYDISVSSPLFYGLGKVRQGLSKVLAKFEQGSARFEQGFGEVLATSEQVFFCKI